MHIARHTTNLELAVLIAHSTDCSGPNSTQHIPPGTAHNKARNAHSMFRFHSARKMNDNRTYAIYMENTT